MSAVRALRRVIHFFLGAAFLTGAFLATAFLAGAFLAAATGAGFATVFFFSATTASRVFSLATPRINANTAVITVTIVISSFL